MKWRPVGEVETSAGELETSKGKVETSECEVETCGEVDTCR